LTLLGNIRISAIHLGKEEACASEVPPRRLYTSWI
jgi:hypothetical protein